MPENYCDIAADVTYLVVGFNTWVFIYYFYGALIKWEECQSELIERIHGFPVIFDAQER